MEKLKVVGLAIFSGGWLVPLYLAYNFYVIYLENELHMRLEQQAPLTSFPFLRLSRQALLVACAWLMIVILIWSILFGRKLLGNAPTGTD
jgi:hypothetical protein